MKLFACLVCAGWIFMAIAIGRYYQMSFPANLLVGFMGGTTGYHFARLLWPIEEWHD
jgi:hypothetical protein